MGVLYELSARWLTIGVVAAAWAACGIRAVTADDATRAEPPATIAIERSAIERGTLSVRIEWAQPPENLERQRATLVLLYQAADEPRVSLDASLLALAAPEWEMGVLTNNCTWVFRPAATNPKPAEIVQLINGDGVKPGSPDFRASGRFNVDLRMLYATGRPRSRGHVQLGLFEQADPTKQHEASTTYRQLSNVVEVK